MNGDTLPPLPTLPGLTGPTTVSNDSITPLPSGNPLGSAIAGAVTNAISNAALPTTSSNSGTANSAPDGLLIRITMIALGIVIIGGAIFLFGRGQING